MQKIFRYLDSKDGKRSLDPEEFELGLKELGINLNKNELESSIKCLDLGKTGLIDFNELLVGVRVHFTREFQIQEGKLL